MKKLLFTLLIFISFITNAQTWCPSGATWYYNGNALMFDGYHKLTYISDSIIGGQTCHKIRDHLEGWNGSVHTNTDVDSFYTYSQTGITYLYNDRYGANRFDTLFNINASIGDKWRMPLADTACDSTLITVMSTGTTVINSFTLKWLQVHYKIYDGTPMNDTIIERIGFTKSFFYFPDVCQYLDERSFTGLRCYSDDTFGSYTTNIANTCNYYWTGISEEKVSFISFYPDPVEDRITLNIPPSIEKNILYEIFNCLGQTVLSGRTNEMINATELENGLYFMVLKDVGGNLLAKEKFIKKRQ